METYNNKKIQDVEVYKRQVEVLNNWRDEYGIPDKSGVYRNAINKLAEKNGNIDQYIDSILPNASETTKKTCQRLINQVFEENLEIYSYGRIYSILQSFNNTIKQKGENTIVYIHDATKSYGLIGCMYSKINPDIKTVTGWNNLKEYLKDNPDTNIVILDDCIGSGESAIKTLDGEDKPAQQNFLKIILRFKESPLKYRTGSAIMFPYIL